MDLIISFCLVFFFNDTATTEIYTLSLHDALPIGPLPSPQGPLGRPVDAGVGVVEIGRDQIGRATSELQSQFHLVCRLLLEKKKKITNERDSDSSIICLNPLTRDRVPRHSIHCR